MGTMSTSAMINVARGVPRRMAPTTVQHTRRDADAVAESKEIVCASRPPPRPIGDLRRGGTHRPHLRRTCYRNLERPSDVCVMVVES